MVCACRKAQRIRGEGVGDIEGHMCIGVGDIAEFLVTSGKDAKYITRDEALEIINRSEKKGFVHQIVNVDGPERIVGICNCSPGCCYGLRPRSCSTPRTCPPPRTAPMSTRPTASPAVSASKSAPPALPSWARSSTERTTPKSSTRSTTCPMTTSGARTAGTPTTETTTRSTLIRPVHRRVNPPAPRTSRSRVM